MQREQLRKRRRRRRRRWRWRRWRRRGKKIDLRWLTVLLATVEVAGRNCWRRCRCRRWRFSPFLPLFFFSFSLFFSFFSLGSLLSIPILLLSSFSLSLHNSYLYILSCGLWWISLSISLHCPTIHFHPHSFPSLWCLSSITVPLIIGSTHHQPSCCPLVVSCPVPRSPSMSSYSGSEATALVAPSTIPQPPSPTNTSDTAHDHSLPTWHC